VQRKRLSCYAGSPAICYGARAKEQRFSYENGFVRYRITNSLQNGLPGPINLIATLVERSPRRLPNALARKLPPDIGAFGVSSTIGSEPDWHFQDKPMHPCLVTHERMVYL
jgi:hypothetical protein